MIVVVISNICVNMISHNSPFMRIISPRKMVYSETLPAQFRAIHGWGEIASTVLCKRMPRGQFAYR